jgi:hypothetical protein
MQKFVMGLIAKSPYTPSKKTTELIIYISSKLKDKAHYSSILLAKSLYLIDSMSYFKKGKSITDFKYIKQERGPTPDPALFIPATEDLVTNGDLQKINADYFGGTQVKFIASREPDIEVFEKDEIFLINDVLESISDQNGTEINDYTPQFIAWNFANHGEELPFYTLLLTSKKPEAKDYEWAAKAVKSYEASAKNAS